MDNHCPSLRYNPDMRYRVFLFEGEVDNGVGIPGNVDWASAGIKFCGEETDGDTALPEIGSTQPDILIKDIEMPFMDGLQLRKVVRESIPRVKTICLGGRDESRCAQSAVKPGGTGFRLKPVSYQDLINSYEKLSAALDRDTQEREDLKLL